MCSRLGCPFKKVTRSPDDGFIRVLIIGATGMTGTAVLSAVITCIWFKVTVLVRRLSGGAMDDVNKKPVSRIVEGDMLNYASVLHAMMDNDVVFFSTTFWDSMRSEGEYEQGFNVVRAAQAAGLKHVVYVGTPYCTLSATEKCKYLMGREKVEALLVTSGLPYTILYLGFYYENFLSVFRPHRVEAKRYALALPMDNIPLNCGSVLDFGHCIAKIMLRPMQTIFKTIKLASGYHTVAELAQMLDDHYPKVTFFDPKIPLSVYRSFDFLGSQELASMFAFYHTITEPWGQEVSQSYYGTCRSFKDWITEHDSFILEVMAEADSLNRSIDIPDGRLKMQFSPFQKIYTELPQLMSKENAFFRRAIGIFNRSISHGEKAPRKASEESRVDDKDKVPPDQLPDANKSRSMALCNALTPKYHRDSALLATPNHFIFPTLSRSQRFSDSPLKGRASTEIK